MKKFLSGILALTLLSSAYGVYANENIGNSIGTSIGTSIGSSSIQQYKSSDLLRLKKYLLGLEEQYFKSYDTNKNGKVNSADLLACKKMLLGLIPNIKSYNDDEVVTTTVTDGVLVGINGIVKDVSQDGKTITISDFQEGYYTGKTLTVDISNFYDEQYPVVVGDVVNVSLKGGTELINFTVDSIPETTTDCDCECTRAYIEEKFTYTSNVYYNADPTNDLSTGCTEYVIKSYDEFLELVNNTYFVNGNNFGLKDVNVLDMYNENFFNDNILYINHITDSCIGYKYSVSSHTFDNKSLSFTIEKTSESDVFCEAFTGTILVIEMPKIYSQYDISSQVN